MKIGDWFIPDTVKTTIELAKRLDTAAAIKDKSIQLHDDETATIQGSGAEPYFVTLQHCTCSDFAYGKATGIPCKHIIRLATELGKTEGLPTYDPEAAAQFDLDAELERLTALWKVGILPSGVFQRCATALTSTVAPAGKKKPASK